MIGGRSVDVKENVFHTITDEAEITNITKGQDKKQVRNIQIIMPRNRSDSKCKTKFKDARTKDQLLRQNSFVKKQLKLNRPPTPPVDVENEFILVRIYS